ncbi:MAG: TonB-dependent receptor, partial [Terracidiphilus sp.]
MPFKRGTISFLLTACACLLAVPGAYAAQNGITGPLRGMVTDPTGAVIPNATVQISSAVSGLHRAATTDATGQFALGNVPFNNYQLTVSAAGFATLRQKVSVSSVVGLNLTLVLQVEATASTVTVQATGDLIEDDPTFHTDVERDQFIKVPLESQSSSLSSLVTLTTPGVSADSNGLFHGLGDHASNSFSVDGQAISDQQSKVFSNQLPSNAIQSIQVISGAPPAEYGDKTSLVIVATTRSGQGVTKPTGSINSSYGSFGSVAGGFDLSYGGAQWGNFLEADALNSGRFLDPPEFAVFHDKGNEENFFDRVDYSFNTANSIHLNMNYSRSWFQTPNAYDNLNVQNVISGGASSSPLFGSVGNADQLSKIGTFNIAPTYTRIISNNSVLNLGAFVRKDLYNYFPSKNPLADLGPANLQTSSIAQIRTLMNTGIHSDVTYTKGIHDIKAGAQYEQTFLRESDSLGIVESAYNSPCMDASGNPLPGYSGPGDCAANSVLPNPNFLQVLRPYDLTRGGTSYFFMGRTDVKELSLYIEDQI